MVADKSPVLILKKGEKELLRILVQLLILSTGGVPDAIKTARVVSILKNECSSYRSISVLGAISTIYETVMNTRLLYKYTSLLITEIKRELETKEIAIGLFLDIRIASDCVNYEI